MTSETSIHQPWTLLGTFLSFHHLMTEFLCELIKVRCTAHKNISVFLPQIFAFSRTYEEAGYMGQPPLSQQLSLDIFAQDYIFIPVHPQAHDTITTVCLGYYNTMPQARVFLNSMHLQLESPIPRHQLIHCLLRIFFFQWWLLSVSSHGSRVQGSPKLLLREVSTIHEDLPS